MMFSMLFTQLLVVLVQLQHSAVLAQASAAAIQKSPPTLQNFQSLQTALKNRFLTANNIPILVRMSFHDLLNFDKATGSAGAQGCLFDQRVAAFKENGGLNGTAQALKAFVEKSFPKVLFSSGDIISLAGKVAYEKVNPCVQIQWSFGRKSCAANEIESGPGPLIDSLPKMTPFLTRYGLTSTEMATLTSGAHAIAGAENNQATSGITSFTFAKVTSGVDFIKKTVSEPMSFFGTWYGNFGPTFPRGTFGRFPSDMLFFPDTVAKAGGSPDRSSEIAAVQKTLLAHTQKTFNQAFGQVYSKMLLIGTSANLTAFSAGYATC